MSIADKLIQAKQDLDEVYEAGQKSEYDRFWDNFQQNGERTKYYYAFSGSCWTQETLKPKYRIKFNDVEPNSTDGAIGTFAYCGFNSDTTLPTEPIDMSEICKMVDWRTCVSAHSVFKNCMCTDITADLSNATTLQDAFWRANAGIIRNVCLKISEKCTNLANAFYYFGANDTEDTELIFMEGSVIACNGLNVQWAKNLTHESLMSIINALKDYSEDTSGTTWLVTLGDTNKAKLTESELEIASNKGWQVK